MSRVNVDLNVVHGLKASQIENAIRHHLEISLGIMASDATPTDIWEAVSLFVLDINLERIHQGRTSEKTTNTHHSRKVSYLSLEFLIGRLLGDNLQNIGLYAETEKAVANLGAEFADVLESETDPALGNGGLGRLAACFMDSLTTLNIPAVGYGINHRFGLFKQAFEGGKQLEMPDAWREYSYPWGTARPAYRQKIKLYGSVSEQAGRAVWKDALELEGIPWDIPVTGYNTAHVNILRLWEGKALNGFDLDSFDQGRYLDARHHEIVAENLTQVLYPNDNHPEGNELRLIQQYFFVACSLADLVNDHRKNGESWNRFAEKNAIQLNDTHPAIAVPEFLRILMDDEGIAFLDALNICRRVFCYTNHTLLPEALEKWPQQLISRVLPRHMQLIHMINHHFLHHELQDFWPDNHQMKRKLSIIEEPGDNGGAQMVRMAYLSVVGSNKVNGVAALHSRLVQENLFPEFHRMWPDKITNVTNGVTPRRWLAHCNPELAALIDQNIKGDWRAELSLLSGVKKLADNRDFQKQYAAIKLNNKRRLADVISQLCGITVNPEAIFDVQIKRLHEYKRQQLNLLHIMAVYRRLLINPDLDVPPRVFIFGAKAAPGYRVAKVIIHAINRLADRVNNDRRIQDKLKIVFLPNYRVTLAEKIIPAADVSEQISTAGFEASGTGNMKMALNGALTIGTLDGANVEIAEEVGDENIFIFGKTVEEVEALHAGHYDPRSIYENHEEIKAVIDWLASGDLTPEEPEAFQPLVDSLLNSDFFLTLPDYQAYSDTHERIIDTWRNPHRWWRMAIINTASVGKFSSDRSIQDYCRFIWK